MDRTPLVFSIFTRVSSYRRRSSWLLWMPMTNTLEMEVEKSGSFQADVVPFVLVEAHEVKNNMLAMEANHKEF